MSPLSGLTCCISHRRYVGEQSLGWMITGTVCWVVRRRLNVFFIEIDAFSLRICKCLLLLVTSNINAPPESKNMVSHRQRSLLVSGDADVHLLRAQMPQIVSAITVNP